MKDKIKEILCTSNKNYISMVDRDYIFDYITNLQERNEKAVEYIKDRLEEGCLDKLNYYDLHKIESILQGENNNEKI